MKRGLILFSLCLLLIPFVAAGDGIEITEASSNTILQPGEIGEYILTLTNLDSQQYKVLISPDPYASLPTSYLDYVFIDPNYVVLDGHSSENVTVTLKVKEEALRQKRYRTYITVEALNDASVSQTYELQVFAMEATDAVSVSFPDMPETVEPGTDLAFTLHLTNNLQKDLSNVDLSIVSDFFETEKTIELFEGQKKDITFTVPVSWDATAGPHTINARVYYDNDLSGVGSVDVSVGENTNIEQTVTEDNGFLFSTITVTKKNTGNTVTSSSYEDDLSLIQGWFVASSLAPTVQGGGSYRWTFNLQPGEEGTVVITVNYRPILIALLVLILLGVIAYYIYTHRVTLKKEVLKTKHSVEGVSDFKVLLHVKNTTNKPIKEVTVIDTLPKIIKPKTTFGTMPPSGVERGDKGTRMMWKIPELLAGEERLFSYDVEAQLKVIGEISLPKAAGKYKTGKNRTANFSSNRVILFSGVMETVKKGLGRE